MSTKLKEKDSGCGKIRETYYWKQENTPHQKQIEKLPYWMNHITSDREIALSVQVPKIHYAIRPAS